MASPQQISTPLTELFGIKHPIVLAGMNVASSAQLAAAVTNAVSTFISGVVMLMTSDADGFHSCHLKGGIGVMGGVGYTPKFLKEQIDDIKAELNDKNAPFGIDLLLPKVGENARATNYDYTGGKLPELIDIIIESGAKLFV